MGIKIIRIKKIEKQMTNKNNLINNIVETIDDIFSLFVLYNEISLVTDKLKPKSVIMLKYAIKAIAKLTSPYFSGPKTLTR